MFIQLSYKAICSLPTKDYCQGQHTRTRSTCFQEIRQDFTGKHTLWTTKGKLKREPERIQITYNSLYCLMVL